MAPGRFAAAPRMAAGLTGFLLSLCVSRAALVLSDTFSYANGSLMTNSAFLWNTHSGTTGQTQVVSGRVQLSQNQSEDVSAALTNGPYSSGMLYASFVVNFSALPGGAGTYFAHFKDNGTMNFRAKVFATTTGAGANAFRVGVANVLNSPAAVIPVDLAPGSNYTFVLRHTPATPVTTLWLNPMDESSTINRADAADTATTLGISTFALRQSGTSPGMGALAFDNLLVGTSFADVVTNSTPPASNTPPIITLQPEDQVVTAGDTVTLTVAATGTPSPSYQWQFFTTNLPGETSVSLILTNVSTSQAGPYAVTITNSAGSTNSQTATLTVNPPPPPAVPGFSIVTYNVHGAEVADWSTNSPQVQAIGRQLRYLQPDIVTFQEIPHTNTWQMVNFVAAYLPGYSLATNSGTDGFIRSVIASRFPITRSTKWLDGVSLVNFGYNGTFTRDLFEVEIAGTNFHFPQPLHVFTTHLKSGQDADNSSRRAAEANAISNFFVTGFLTTNSLRPYLLTGDLNEDIARPPSSNPQTLERLTSAPTGLQPTTPVNPFTASELTFSIQAGSLTKRYDYILPCALLLSNLASNQVFRTDLLASPPPPLLASDDVTASDHLPVQMVFFNPYDKPFRLRSVTRSNSTVTLTWDSVRGQPYRVDSSTNLTMWSPLASGLMATGSSFTFNTDLNDAARFFRVYRVP